ncbi:MAG: hypothetical protein ACREJM_16380, partial [Candidatus Saccharimonadales bacterium]
MPLISCPECRKSVSESAKGCPSCGFTLTRKTIQEQKFKQEDEAQLASFAVVGFLVLVIACIWMSPNSSRENSASWNTIGDNRSGPITCAQFIVKRNLKAPATASFPWSFDDYQ